MLRGLRAGGTGFSPLIPGLLISILHVLGAAACVRAAGSPVELEPVRLQLNWVHQANFAGFYLADQNGYFAENGIAVDFLEMGVQGNPFQPVLDGRAEFGVSGAEQILVARAAGMPVRALAVIFNRSPIVYITPSDSGIASPRDFAGKTIRVSPVLVPTLHAMTAAVGVPASSYTEVTLPSELEAWTSGAADVWGAYIYAFALTLEREGFELTTIFPDDYGVHFYGEVVFTTDEIIESNPDLVQRFLQAALRGYAFALENPQEAGALVAVYDPTADVELEQAKMLASLPLMHVGSEPLGWMQPAKWSDMERTLREEGVLSGPLDVTEAYTTRFLDAIYGGGSE